MVKFRMRFCLAPINSSHTLPTFGDSAPLHSARRWLFFEWKVIKGQKAKQPYAIAMKDGKPFGIGGLWNG
jgi:hypothetical protein